MIHARELAARFEAYGDWRRRLSAGVSAMHEWLAEQDLAERRALELVEIDEAQSERRAEEQRHRAGPRPMPDPGVGLAADRAQAEALGGVVARVPEPPVVEDEGFRAPPFEEQLAIVAAGDGLSQHGEGAGLVDRGLERAETSGVLHRASGDLGGRPCSTKAASCPCRGYMVQV
mgnify:CR=1 FL=1